MQATEIPDSSPIEVITRDLPSESKCILNNHDFSLPSPENVRARAKQDGIDITHTYRPDPVKFPELGLIVKWGRDVTIAEGQCLWFISKHLRHDVPIPKVFGWKQDGDQAFLYLELIEGDTLATRWNDLRDDEKERICEQLRAMIGSWRRIVKPTDSEFQLSQIGDQALRDIMFSDVGQYPAGPFPTVFSFHDAFAGLLRRTTTSSRNEIEELAGLNDDIPVVFTNGDLDQSNILISRPGDVDTRIEAIIDWHQSGWYPEPWEILKAKCVAEPGGEWVERWLPKVLKEPEFAYFYAWEFLSVGVI